MKNGTNIAKGIGSGFVATIVLSVFMLMKQGVGLCRGLPRCTRTVTA
jgi:hypothetical protein